MSYEALLTFTIIVVPLFSLSLFMSYKRENVLHAVVKTQKEQIQVLQGQLVNMNPVTSPLGDHVCIQTVTDVFLGTIRNSLINHLAYKWYIGDVEPEPVLYKQLIMQTLAILPHLPPVDYLDKNASVTNLLDARDLHSVLKENSFEDIDTTMIKNRLNRLIVSELYSFAQSEYHSKGKE